MFKGITINLSGPICRCDEQKLEWGIMEGPGIYLRCKTCDVILRVPNKQFVASYKLDTPYPGKPEPKLESIDGGKLLDMKARFKVDTSEE